MPFLETCYPRELVCELLTKCQAWEQRERKLSQLVIVYYVIALSLFRQFNVTEVFAQALVEACVGSGQTPAFLCPPGAL